MSSSTSLLLQLPGGALDKALTQPVGRSAEEDDVDTSAARSRSRHVASSVMNHMKIRVINVPQTALEGLWSRS